jgi:hypothetical protein
MSDEELAWEFLRRDPGYRQAYNEAQSLGALPEDLFRDPSKWGLRSFVDPDLSGHMRESIWDEALRSNSASAVRTLSDNDNMKTPPPFGELQVAIDVRRPKADLIEEIVRQIDDYRKKRAISEPRLRRRIRRKLLPAYLRALDAEASGLTPGEMVRALRKLGDPHLPQSFDIQNVRRSFSKRLAAARELSKAGYKDIVRCAREPDPFRWNFKELSYSPHCNEGPQEWRILLVVSFGGHSRAESYSVKRIWTLWIRTADKEPAR